MMTLLFVALTSCALSLAIDFAAGAWLTSSVPLIGSFARLSLSKNAGIAFSIKIPSPWQEIVILGALAAVFMLAMKSALTRFSSVGYGMIFGGAVANLIDRLPDGTVTDFIAVGTFPVFNVADSCITVGVALLLLDGWIHHKKTATGSR